MHQRINSTITQLSRTHDAFMYKKFQRNRTAELLTSEQIFAARFSRGGVSH